MTLPALVQPAAELSREEVERYSRQLIIPDVGVLGQRRLKNARVLVIGAGGLGSPALMYLAAAGVGTLGVVDFDTVDASNLQRQVIHRTADVGRPKTESAVDAVAAINPLVRVIQHAERLDSGNALAVMAGYDLVLDGTDNFATRYLVNDACVLTGKPCIWGSIFRFEGQASVFWAEHGPQYRDVYPVPPPPGAVPSCAEGGVLGVLCATIGSVMVTEAIKLICGIGEPLLGRLLIYDALELSFRTVNVRPDPQGASITALIDYEQFCASGPVATQDSDDVAAHSISSGELKLRLDAGEDLLLIDVREPAEREIVKIDGSTLIPVGDLVSGSALPRLTELAGDRPIVLHCKSGARSALALKALRGAGFVDAVHLRGGILAWIDEIDPCLSRY
ncbi:MAG: molybdopterin-synthase adenylyltransferase MoeB [Actinomycetota bacterium]|nr:molybdopterin-synthase adenylyltransferase MoeB [Actinomycetota bacterium]